MANKKKKSKLLNLIIWVILGYAAGFAVAYFTATEATMEITTYFTSTTTFIGAGIGFFLWIFFTLTAHTPSKKNTEFTGTTSSGEKIEQHYNARFVTEQELLTNPKYMPTTFKDLPNLKKTGVFLRSLQQGNTLHVNMYDPIHTLIIGTTGSGKSTYIIEPAIRCYAHSAEKPCIVVSDPKGDLFNNHSLQLKQEGYRIIVLDLRNPYSSTRWNPMSNSYDMYHRAHNLKKEVKVYNGVNPKSVPGVRVIAPNYGQQWFLFNNIAYPDRATLEQDLEATKQSLIGEAENELKEIAMNIVTIESKNDASWERGAQEFLYGLMIAMLEDSMIPELNLTREKFNFYNLNKIATTRDPGENMMDTLKKYASGRDKFSKVPALVNAVINSAPNTTRSFLSVLQPKIAIFNDLGVCYATSESDISFADFTDKPTALFIKVPDEKESRHCIATMCISQLYKSLIAKASSYANLQLKKPVYFILDEFANLPKIEKMDSIITVARARRIFFTLAVQSYSQLDNKYGKECADIIRGNCNIQIYIGTEDQKTREDFSKMCGDITIRTETVSKSKNDKNEDGNSTSTQQQITTRPLIEPYELGQLPHDVNIIKIYGCPPIKTQMTPIYKCTIFDHKIAADEYVPSRYLNEQAIYYDIKERNAKMVKNTNPFDDFDF